MTPGRFARAAPLGLRFRDAATGEPVRDGLAVTAGGGGRAVPAARTPGGVYAFHDLPGLTAWARPADGGRAWADPPAVTVTVTVTDPAGRFLPRTVAVTAPARWPADPADAGHPEQGQPVPLYSAPTRPVPPGLAAVRAQFVAPGGGWAAGAVLELRAGAELVARGYADGGGRVAVYFLPPPPPDPPAAVEWELGVVIRYGPPAGGWPAAPDPSAVFAQAEATGVARAGEPAGIRTVTVRPGAETVLRTADSPTGGVVIAGG